MPDLNAWLEGDTAFDSDPLFDLTGIMKRRGQSITLVRGSAALAAQTVIVAPLVALDEITGAAGTSGTDRLQLIGWRAYTGKTDFDVKRQDLFAIGTQRYRVTLVDDSIPGRRVANCEATQ